MTQSVLKNINGLIFIQLLLVMVSQHLLEDNYKALAPIKFMVNSSLFYLAFVSKKDYLWQKQMFLTFILIFIADIFLVLLGGLPWFSPETPSLKLIGMLFFALGYINFVKFTLKYKKFLLRDFFIFFLLFSISGLVCFACLKSNSFEKIMMPIIFFSFITIVSFFAITCRENTFFKKSSSNLIKIMGFLFFISELFFGLAVHFQGINRNMPIIGNFIWITYIPSWLIFLNLMKSSHLFKVKKI